MTTPVQGRPAATFARPGRVLLRACLVLALGVPALTAFARPAVAPNVPPAAVAKSETPVVAGATAPSKMHLPPLALGMPEEAVGEPVSAEPDSKVKTVLQKALALLGTPYRWGGTDPDKGFDCSGLVGYVFRNALGIELPRVSRDMAKNGELITDRAKLVAGDLVFFGLKGRINHVGIYVGEGRFVHAPRRGRDVTVSSMDKGYWSGRFLQARRVGTPGT